MAIYTIQADSESQTTPVLRKGPLRIYADTSVYFTVGEDPVAVAGKSALIRAGETKELRLPVKCSKIAVLAVEHPGTVVISELTVGPKSSCAQ